MGRLPCHCPWLPLMMQSRSRRPRADRRDGVRRGMRNHSTTGMRTLSVFVVAVLGVATLAFTAAAAGAADSALANLKITADNVQIKPKGKSTFVAAKDGMALKQGDTIKTDDTGRAEIDYTDGSLTRMSGSTI